jgi:hypothetical protein
VELVSLVDQSKFFEPVVEFIQRPGSAIDEKKRVFFNFVADFVKSALFFNVDLGGDFGIELRKVGIDRINVEAWKGCFVSR